MMSSLLVPGTWACDGSSSGTFIIVMEVGPIIIMTLWPSLSLALTTYEPGAILTSVYPSCASFSRSFCGPCWISWSDMPLSCVSLPDVLPFGAGDWAHAAPASSATDAQAGSISRPNMKALLGLPCGLPSARLGNGRERPVFRGKWRQGAAQPCVN